METQVSSRVCGLCLGVGWLYATDAEGNIIWQSGHRGTEPKLVRCRCMESYDKARQRTRLEQLDGLTETERQRSFKHTRPHPSQQAAFDCLSDAAVGIVTMQGAPGTGKTHLLQCTVNQAREAGKVAVYSTMTDVLDYLRRAFKPDADEHFEERWQLLLSADVLALDELDEFNATAWAKERFLRLIDERWRNQHKQLTAIAMNGDLEDLHPKVESRLAQGTVFHMTGVDMRRVLR